MKTLKKYDYDDPPRRSDLTGAVVFLGCYDDWPEYLVFQEAVEVDPETVVLEDKER